MKQHKNYHPDRKKQDKEGLYDNYQVELRQEITMIINHFNNHLSGIWNNTPNLVCFFSITNHLLNLVLDELNPFPSYKITKLKLVISWIAEEYWNYMK